VLKVDCTRAAVVTRTAVNLLRLAAIVAWPFIPSSAERVLQSLGEFEPVPPFPDRGGDVLSAVPAGRPIVVPSLLFPELDAAMIGRLAARYEQRCGQPPPVLPATGEVRSGSAMRLRN
jgi:methionyl-tRNA synthetase